MRQVAALPFSIDADGSLDVWLVTSRGTGRWIIPKGNPIRGLAPHEAAAQEAMEEAGLLGRAEKQRIGIFEFDKIHAGRKKTCAIDVYLMKVERQLQSWAEMDQRSVLRCSVETALSLICSPSLGQLINDAMSHEKALRPVQ